MLQNANYLRNYPNGSAHSSRQAHHRPLREMQNAGKSAIVGQSGKYGCARSTDGRTVISHEFTAQSQRTFALLVGDFFLMNSLQETLLNDEITVALIVDEYSQPILLFDADLHQGYQVELPLGGHSIFIFLIESAAPTFFGSQTYPIGFPRAIDLSRIDALNFEDHGDVWRVIDDSPGQLPASDSCAFDFLLVETERVFGYSTFFGDLLGAEPKIASSSHLVTCPHCNGNG